MTVLIVMALAGAGTYLIRASMVVAVDRFGAPTWMEDRLRLVAPAVLAAMVSTSLFVDGGQPVSASGAEVVAVAAGSLVALRTRNVAIGLGIGLAVFWVAAAAGLG